MYTNRNAANELTVIILLYTNRNQVYGGELCVMSEQLAFLQWLSGFN